MSRNPTRAIQAASALISLIKNGPPPSRVPQLLPPPPKPAPKKNRSNLTFASNSSLRTISPPIARGTQSSSSHKHTPFVVKGRCVTATLGSSNTAGAYLAVSNAGGAAMAAGLAAWNVDIIGTSVIPTNFKSFPTTVTAIAASFTRYRFKKLLMHYVSACSTSTSGALAMGASPEVFSAMSLPSESPSFASITSINRSTITPVWANTTFDLLEKGGLRSEWLYADPTNSISEAVQRQESPGSIVFAFSGGSTGVTLGYLFLEFEVEFDGLAAANLWTSHAPRKDDVSRGPEGSSSQLPANSDTPRPTLQSMVHTHDPGYVLLSREQSHTVPIDYRSPPPTR